MKALIGEPLRRYLSLVRGRRGRGKTSTTPQLMLATALPCGYEAQFWQIADALRDTLLPKLICDELRVKDAERFLKDRGL